MIEIMYFFFGMAFVIVLLAAAFFVSTMSDDELDFDSEDWLDDKSPPGKKRYNKSRLINKGGSVATVSPKVVKAKTAQKKSRKKRKIPVKRG